MTDIFSLERDGLRQAKPNKHHDEQHQGSQNDPVDLDYRVRDPLKAGIVSTVHGEFIAHCLTASPSRRPDMTEIILDRTSTRRHQSSLCYMLHRYVTGGRLTKKYSWKSMPATAYYDNGSLPKLQYIIIWCCTSETTVNVIYEDGRM